MSIHKSLLAASLFTLGLGGHPVLSQAYDGDSAPGYGHHCRHFGDARKFHGWERVADRLNLSKEQRQAMNAIEDKYRPEMRDLRQLFSDNHAALVKMDATDAKLQETAEAQGKTMADIVDQVLNFGQPAPIDGALPGG